MSHRALSRLVIRLLHDPSLAARLAADADDALAGAEVSADERAWLAAVPEAAWRTDPDRPRRVLAALRDEYPATTSLAAERAERFFASPHFHRAVQDRGSLAIAYGAHMADDGDARVAALATLECAMARARRAPKRPSPSAAGHLRLAPAALVVRVRSGTSALLASLRAGRRPVALATTEETLLVERDAATLEVRIEMLETGLAAVLRRAERPVPREDLEAVVRTLGGDERDARAVVERLIADRILI